MFGYLLSLTLAAVSFGLWRHSVNAGVFVFFALVLLSSEVEWTR